MKIKILLLTVVMITAFLSCEKDEPPVVTNEFTNQDLSEWIFEWMNTVYFWSSQIPQNTNNLNFNDPAGLFFNILNRPEDRFSNITDDYESFLADLQGNPLSMGYSPAFGLVEGSSTVFIIVEYVYENTPASRAGLERGDLIISINNQQMDTLNYFNLYSQTNYSVQLGRVENGNLVSTGESFDLSAETISKDPILHTEVMDIGGSKIGYLVFAEFISGTNNIFLNQLTGVFEDFIAEGVDELIIDLRYNPGGEITVAGHLASLIAPESVNRGSSVLVDFQYNNTLTQYFIDEEGTDSPNLTLKFPSTTVSLNLNRVTFLTARGTASASELLITGLDPYMEVVTVGETTVGKYTGSWVIYDTEQPPRHNWAIIPIVLKYANSLGITDFKDGLDPDYPVEDDLFNARSFGDLTDPVLARAIEVLTGNRIFTEKSAQAFPAYRSIYSPEKREAQRLYLPAPSGIREKLQLKSIK